MSFGPLIRVTPIKITCSITATAGIDNVEHIYTPADANFTDYEIVVLFSDEHDVNQPQVSPPYAVAWNVGPKPARDDSLWFDLNADGVVDDLDVNVLLDNLIASMETSDRYLFGDINSDGVIDISDLDILMRYIDSAADSRYVTDSNPADTKSSNKLLSCDRAGFSVFWPSWKRR